MKGFVFEVNTEKIANIKTEINRVLIDLMTNTLFNKITLIEISTNLISLYDLSLIHQPKNKINYIKYIHEEIIIVEYKKGVQLELQEAINSLNWVYRIDNLENFLFIYFNSCDFQNKSVS